MATMTSQVPAVTDYLVTTCQNSVLLGLANPPVTVLDGPDVTADIRVQQQLLWIGYNPLAADAEAATATQMWPIMDHARTLDEDGEILCAAEFWTGTTTMKTARDGCASIVGSVATLLRGDPSGGGPGDTSMGALVFWSRISEWSWRQQQGPDGTSVLCVFKIVYKMRLTA